MKLESHSQYEQDVKLFEKYFKYQKQGFFVEIGADDGVDKSNTLFYEKRGWKGICVEPSPGRFAKLDQNRQCIKINRAISDKVGEFEFMEITGYSHALSGLVNNYDPKHKERIDEDLKRPDNTNSEVIKVKTEKLSNIFQNHGVKKVDFLSMDIEGGEIDALNSIDFKAVRINLILIEDNYNNPEIKLILENNGFVLIENIVIDKVFLHKSFLNKLRFKKALKKIF